MQFKLIHLVVLTLVSGICMAFGIKVYQAYPDALWYLSVAVSILLAPGLLALMFVSFVILVSADPWEFRVRNFGTCWMMCFKMLVLLSIPWSLTLIAHLANRS